MRAAADASSTSLGILSPGERAEYRQSVPRWHKVRLPNGPEGFVSKAWTEVVPDAIVPTAATAFTIHFLDVGTGDAAIIDVGDREMVAIDGVRILFTGDANGKERTEPGPGTPSHVEAKLLAIEQAHPGTLKAHILKAPHHGSETASTQAFINAVDPDFVIISASTTHHLPKDTVIERYRNGQRVILRTDVNREKDRDHILCGKLTGVLDCNFADVFGQ